MITVQMINEISRHIKKRIGLVRLGRRSGSDVVIEAPDIQILPSGAIRIIVRIDPGITGETTDARVYSNSGDLWITRDPLRLPLDPDGQRGMCFYIDINVREMISS